MANSTRTFVAIEIPAGLRDRLARFQKGLDREAPGVRWVDPSQYHLTLAFLGDVLHADLTPICRAVAAAAAGFETFELLLRGLGVFPSPQKPRVLWVGAEGPGLDTLMALQAAVAAAVNDAGYPPDERFHPHITLGRPKPAREDGLDAAPLLARHRDWSTGRFLVTQVVTFSSSLTSEGPVYARMASASLRSRKTRTTP